MSDAQKIFVFGSNELGIHGAGAAKFAMENKAALWGQGEGRQGQSYAIPTKASPKVPLPLQRIKVHVDRFLGYAQRHPDLTFELTAIGTGLAGYSPSEIAPMFKEATPNIDIPKEFLEYL